MNILDYIKAGASFVWLFVANVFFVLSGLVMVPLAIPFHQKGFSVSDGRSIVNLPKWAYVWGNDFDGLLGDKRGWWAANTPFHLPVDHFFSMFMWAAVRNPANNMRMLKMFQAPITNSTITYKGDYDVQDDPGEGGWQFVKTENAGKSWYGLYIVKSYNSTHAFVLRLGFKITPSHQGTADLPKGFVTKISFYKEL